MIDNHDRCEWVNVSSGTGSPDCLRQSPESRKMVVVVLTNLILHTSAVAVKAC